MHRLLNVSFKPVFRLERQTGRQVHANALASTYATVDAARPRSWDQDMIMGGGGVVVTVLPIRSAGDRRYP